MKKPKLEYDRWSPAKRKLFYAIIIAMTAVAIALFSFAIWRAAHNTGWRQQLKMYSNADHGQNVDDFIRNVSGEEHEYIAIFEMNGNKLIESTSKHEDFVRLPDEASNIISERSGLLTIHNHPGVESTFSPRDLMMNESYCRMAIVVSENTVYVLQKGERGDWPDKAETDQYLEDILERFSNGYVRDQFITVRDGEFLLNYTNDAFMQKYADYFNLDYKVFSIDEFNYAADWAP